CSFTVPSPTNTYTLSLHDALPISQKKKYFPRLAKGAISAFALTEHGVGSDPAAMETNAILSDDGDAWILNGEKLWCTNGTKAELDRKSTRLNSSHDQSSYAVFCLK